jgi:hypothetical protein
MHQPASHGRPRLRWRMCSPRSTCSTYSSLSRIFVLRFNSCFNCSVEVDDLAPSFAWNHLDIQIENAYHK